MKLQVRCRRLPQPLAISGAYLNELCLRCVVFALTTACDGICKPHHGALPEGDVTIMIPFTSGHLRAAACTYFEPNMPRCPRRLELAPFVAVPHRGHVSRRSTRQGMPQHVLGTVAVAD